MRIEESSPLMYVLMVGLAIVLIGVVLLIYASELSGLLKALGTG